MRPLLQEFDSLREQLINGQLTRAQQAEEIVLLRNELAVTRKKLTKLESESVGEKGQREGNVAAAVPEWAETNGHRQETHVSGCGYGRGLTTCRACVCRSRRCYL